MRKDYDRNSARSMSRVGYFHLGRDHLANDIGFGYGKSLQNFQQFGP